MTDDPDFVLQLLSLLGAVCSFTWGVWVWRQATKARLAQEARDRQSEQETRRIEASKPFLEKQLRLYSELVDISSKIASNRDEKTRQIDVQRFWQLYWGEIGLVDNPDVQKALEYFGQAVEYKSTDYSSLRHRCVELVAACRGSLAKSWATEVWLEPDRNTSPQQGIQPDGSTSGRSAR